MNQNDYALHLPSNAFYVIEFLYFHVTFFNLTRYLEWLGLRIIWRIVNKGPHPDDHKRKNGPSVDHPPRFIIFDRVTPGLNYNLNLRKKLEI